MSFPVPTHRPRRTTSAFTLVEVALALGIAAFVLAGLIGAIPLASDVGRQSVTQNRAASIASTIFANLRAQKFSTATYLDDVAVHIDLNVQNTVSDPSNPQSPLTKPLSYYAYFDEIVNSSSSSDKLRLHFLAQPPTGAPFANPVFQITLNFKNRPPGTLVPYSMSGGVTHAQANAVEASIFAVARPKDVYRFSSVIANRSE